VVFHGDEDDELFVVIALLMAARKMGCSVFPTASACAQAALRNLLAANVPDMRRSSRNNDECEERGLSVANARRSPLNRNAALPAEGAGR
jgi:hypothetical protein